ncbi:MAG: CBS domain-containing protein [Eubacteriales bacterium]|jgi:CBS domain-containing protein|nr:CBS domain-containing protein [Bacillota bacterium]MBV1726923.1 CBS domain-containing protein [Desulforudis sp.]MDQ7788951.1 CBS domain-containing protein [Clostridia bacterium]MDZ4044059.1 CBS domain-containing protein [Eubacteriales bacterium]MBU4533966.1 CBS domain-containing protein [Bacillota bacterium]
MTEKLARDVMTTEVISVHPDDEIEKVAQLLLEHHISGLPVLNDEGKLVGVVTEGDLVIREKKVRAPLHVVILDSLIYLEKPHRFIEEVKRAAAQKVGEVMSTKLYTVGPDASVEKVATKMVERRINRVPVVDTDNKLLGIISRQDIIRATFAE